MIDYRKYVNMDSSMFFNKESDEIFRLLTPESRMNILVQYIDEKNELYNNNILNALKECIGKQTTDR